MSVSSVPETQGSAPSMSQRHREVYQECPRVTGVFQECPRDTGKRFKCPRDTGECSKSVPETQWSVPRASQRHSGVYQECPWSVPESHGSVRRVIQTLGSVPRVIHRHWGVQRECPTDSDSETPGSVSETQRKKTAAEEPASSN